MRSIRSVSSVTVGYLLLALLVAAQGPCAFGELTDAGLTGVKGAVQVGRHAEPGQPCMALGCVPPEDHIFLQPWFVNATCHYPGEWLTCAEVEYDPCGHVSYTQEPYCAGPILEEGDLGIVTCAYLTWGPDWMIICYGIPWNP